MKRNIKLIPIIILAGFCLLQVMPSVSIAKSDTDGFLYGKVTTRSGNSYIGLLRWGTEEAFWDDLFNSSKEDLPYTKYVEKAEFQDEYDEYFEEAEELNEESVELEHRAAELEEEGLAERSDVRDMRREARMMAKEAEKMQREAKKMAKQTHKYRRKSIGILGGSIVVNLNSWGGSRQFIARFGDIAKIEVIGSEDAKVTMKNGSLYVVSGYANDVGGEITIKDASLGEIDVPWKKIDTIEFMQTPGNVKPDGYRMRGFLLSDAGEFEGFIQWDSEECLSTDKLDGDSEDGRLAIEMGTIRSIERRSQNSCRVELKDGRKMVLDGTNDVDGSIRGIYVEDPKFGRVKVSWESFEKVDFHDKSDSGRDYDSYKAQTKLRGTITDIDTKEFSGIIVFDIDESESWEMLNGDRFDVEFFIPFDRIATISPRSRSASMIVLRNGEKLRLDSSKDVSGDNDGVLIFKNEDDKEPKYMEWDEIEKIAFE
ncbi:MAG: hypothetical protein P9L92_05690 [Candidatus Electryonea clarkiae]|nr:hypothetical protein [Candidatus Electryonea clarkiae]MDP8289322.1 hypothetical protein [Candidatus Electryonea clarkiae]